jgi:hypothetical protein
MKQLSLLKMRITDILVRAGLEKGHADEENCNVLNVYVIKLMSMNLMHMPDKDFKRSMLRTSNDPFPYHELAKLLHPQEMGYYDSLAFEKEKRVISSDVIKPSAPSPLGGR